MAQFKNNPRFQVLIGGSRAKTILGINERKKPLDDVRVRRAILAAIDRKAMIEGAVDGFGTPIGSHYTPGRWAMSTPPASTPSTPKRPRSCSPKPA